MNDLHGCGESGRIPFSSCRVVCGEDEHAADALSASFERVPDRRRNFLWQIVESRVDRSRDRGFDFVAKLRW
jgi:hypothetical protein